MKHAVGALALVLGLSVVGPAALAASGPPSSNVAWQAAAADADIDRAFAQAKAEKKPVLLYWGATWCPPCNQLKATLFNRQDFIERSKSVVAVNIDVIVPALERLLAAFHGPPAPGLPRFWGGLVGVWGHDMVRVFEQFPPGTDTARASDLPALDLVVSDTVVVFDNFSQRVQIVAVACPESDGGLEAATAAARARVDEVAALLDSPHMLRPQRLPALASAAPDVAPTAPWTREGYLEAVRRARAYISAGDIFQVVLGQRFTAPFTLPPVALCRQRQECLHLIAT